jgi:hypothetical protein
MGRPGLKFNRSTTGLDRALPGKDHYSAMSFYIADANLPSGFSTSNRIQRGFSLAQFEAMGILKTHLNEVAATATITITATGADGDIIAINVTEYGTGTKLGQNNIVSLGTYKKLTADSTVTLVAVGIKNAINLLTSVHGYTASNIAGVITITARPGLGAFLNSGVPLSTTIVGAMTRTLTQFTGGVASDIDQVHYHISEAFRINPGIVLTVELSTPPVSTHTFTEIPTLINYIPGDIRNLGVYTTIAMSTAMIDTLNTQLQTLAGLSKPCSSVLTADISASTLSNMSDLSLLTDWRVTYDIAQDMGGVGYTLFKALGKTVGTMGATVGAMSLAPVDECIGWVAKYNMSDGTELETIGFGNGIFFNDPTVLVGTLLDTLWAQQYSFLQKENNRSGTYFVDSNTCAPASNTFNKIENVRTSDKMVRGIESNATDLKNGPLVLKADGTLTELSLAEVERVVNIALDQMVAAGEISVNKVTINPAQIVSQTSEVDVNVDYVAIGVGRNIVINTNQTKSLA